MFQALKNLKAAQLRILAHDFAALVAAAVVAYKALREAGVV